MRLALLLAVAACGCSPAESRTKMAKRACPSVKAPYYFRVSKGDAVSYLLGTRHTSIPAEKLQPTISEGWRAAQTVVFETSLDDPARPWTSTELPDVLGADDWKRYCSLLGGDHACDAMTNASPALATFALYNSFEDGTYHMDQELKFAANRDAKPIVGLEKTTFQQDTVERLMDARYLRMTVKYSRAEMREMAFDGIRQYCEGAYETAGPSAKERAHMRKQGYSDAEIDQFVTSLFIERNRAWILELEPMLDRGGAFVVVGAGHLIGTDSVPALLTAKGYQVARLN